jgi:hypothetical protein
MVFFTCITHYYDPVTIIQGQIPLHSSFLALLVTKKKSINAYQRVYLTKSKSNNAAIQWNMIELKVNGFLFRAPSKLTETLKL